MKLIIIGNGMDINHRLNTRWGDILDKNFRKELQELSPKIKMLSEDCVSWSDFEDDIRSMVMAHLAIFWGKQNIKKYLEKRLNNVWLNQFQNYKWKMHDYVKKFYLLCRDDLEDNNKDIGDTVKKHIKNFKIDFRDYSIKIINKIAEKIQEEIKRSLKENLVSENINEKVKNVFKNNDFVVINYNYTKIYENIYFKSEDVVYIHNSIDLKDKFHKDSVGLGVDIIMVGYYNSNLGNEKFHLNDKYDVSGFPKPNYSYLSTENWEYFLRFFRSETGYNRLYFLKNPSKTGTKQLKNKWQEIKDKIKLKKSCIDEIVFLGHSINDNDINELRERLKKELSLEKIKKISSYNYFKCKDESKEHENKIKKYWDIENLNIYSMNNEIS